MKRKITINRPEISSEEIAKHKNFDSVLKHHTGASKPFFKKPLFLSSVLVTVAAIVTSVVLLTKNPKSAINKEQLSVNSDSISLAEFYKKEETKSCIHPPLKGLDIDYTTYKVIAEKGATLDFKTGSKLIVPKNAFADENGKPLKGEIELRYREFHDAADFFVSGIPMTYDSAGVKYQFESAGMMEMQGYQDGKKIRIANDKSIAIELASEYKGTEYNLYELDTANNNWSCLGKDKVKEKPKEAIKKENSATAKVEETPEYKTIEAKKEEVKKQKETTIATLPKPTPEPRKPVLAVNSKRTFDIAVESKEFPELAIYKGVLFEIGDENKNFNPVLYDITWDDASLKDGTKKGINYSLTLTKGVKKYQLVVYPVFEGKNYETAMKEYQDKFTKYSAALDKREAAENRIQEEYQSKMLALKQQQEDAMLEWKKKQDDYFKLMDTQEKVCRMFSISKFGWFNSDCPSTYPKGVSCTANLMKGKNEPLQCYNVYLVDKARNGIFTFYKNPVTSFSFNPESKNMLWTVENGVLYYLKPEQFKDIKSTDELSSLKMNRVEAKLTTMEDFKSYFKM